jgi:hypothetical protein
MRSTLQNPPDKILSIGKAAFEWMSSDRNGEVMASVSHAAYLLLDQGEPIWLATEITPMHRRGLRVPSPLPRLEVGTTFWVRNHSLEMDSGETFDFTHTPVWKAPRPPCRETAAMAGLADRVTAFYTRFIDEYSPAGLGSMIPAILQTAKGESPKAASSQGGMFPSAALPSVTGAVRACLAHDLSLLLEHAAHLVGLGEGLTPSGDDFLGGLFFGLQLLQAGIADIPELMTWNYPDFILLCKTLTNLISFSLLKDHAAGHTLEPLHRLANGVLAGEPIEHLFPYAGETIGVGHSTGWDMLSGFLAGMCVTFPQRPSA